MNVRGRKLLHQMRVHWQLYLLLLQRLVQLPAEGVVGHDVWTSLAEFCENLVNVSRQWGDHATPAMTVGVWRRVRGRC